MCWDGNFFSPSRTALCFAPAPSSPATPSSVLPTAGHSPPLRATPSPPQLGAAASPGSGAASGSWPFRPRWAAAASRVPWPAVNRLRLPPPLPRPPAPFSRTRPGSFRPLQKGILMQSRQIFSPRTTHHWTLTLPSPPCVGLVCATSPRDRP